MIEFETQRAPDAPSKSSLDAYEEIYRTAPIAQLESFYIWALRLSDPRPGLRLLDVSCGIGRLVDIAAKQGLKAVGLDLSRTAVTVARSNGGRGDLVVGDAERLPFPDDCFDRVINLGSLEHYQNPDRGAAEMARVLRPGGKAVVLLPNSFAYHHVLYVWRTGRVFDDGQPLQRYGTQADWRDLLERNGLGVERAVKYQYVRPFTGADMVWYICRPLKLLQMLLDPLIPLNAANCFVFICRRKSAIMRH